MARVATVCLVSCVGAKGATTTEARDLYQSNWFIKARAYVEGFGSNWFILSAKHGLVRPDDLIARYNQTLNTIGIAERRSWARQVGRVSSSGKWMTRCRTQSESWFWRENAIESS
jgi:hypothetical protein